MAVVEELLREEADGTISFGNHTLEDKAKVEDFPHDGDLYKVKTFRTMTKLEKNGMFLYESVPGTSVTHFDEKEDGVSFIVDVSQGTTDCCIHAFWETNSLRRTMQIVECSLLHRRAQGRVSS